MYSLACIVYILCTVIFLNPANLAVSQALCVEMKNIQTKMNVINRHGQYFMKKARSGLREILEERLKALNNQWDKLQDHASARQKDLEQLVQDKADNEAVSGDDSSLASLRNNTALLSSLYFNTENEVGLNVYTWDWETCPFGTLSRTNVASIL